MVILPDTGERYFSVGLLINSKYGSSLEIFSGQKRGNFLIGMLRNLDLEIVFYKSLVIFKQSYSSIRF